jgi:flagellar biosynthesis GTPase FlhF
MCTLFAAFAVLALEAAQPYERYQTIVDRKPFGPEPVNFDPEAAPGSAAANVAAAAGEMTEAQRTVEEQQLASSVRVSMINVTPSGAVAVGFTDTSVNPAENYYLIVGRSQNGWTVKSADPATESVTLEKGGVDVTVKLGETSGGKGKDARAHRANRPMTLQARGGAPAAPAPEAAADAAPPGAPMGGLARLRMRRAEMRARAQVEAEQKAQAAAKEAAEREEREAREAEEKRARAEREAREAEEREQQREALRQIQEQLRKDREAKAAAQDGEHNQEGQSEADNVE